MAYKFYSINAIYCNFNSKNNKFRMSSYTTPVKRQNSSQTEYTMITESKQVFANTPIRSSPQQEVQQISVQNVHLKLAFTRLINQTMQESFTKIKFFSKKNLQRRKRLTFGISRVFRAAFHDLQFTAFQKIKRVQISQKNQELKYTQKLFAETVQIGFRLLFNFFRNKHRRIIEEGFAKMQTKALTQRSERKRKLMAMYSVIVGGRNQRIREAMAKMRTCRYIDNRKVKARQIQNVIKDIKRRNLLVAYSKLKRNYLSCKSKLIKNEVGQLDQRIHTERSEELFTCKGRMQELQEQIKSAAQEKNELKLEFKNEIHGVQEKSDRARDQSQRTLNQNQQLRKLIQQTIQQTNCDYSMDEICNFLYNNMLLFLHKSPHLPVRKEDLLESITDPLIPIKLDIEAIKEENQAMQELITQYIVVFGMKTLSSEGREVEKTYEHLQKENYQLHKLLLTLMSRVNITRDDIGNMRDGIVEVAAAVKELDTFENSLNEKKKILM